ncbi:MAG: hypothetical protein EP343_24420 [Deltaproteobacteria bacterium]|nr:MAG: hypothetical protein EP343_24420 [Deltaproteobacteria bacterium]
MKSVFTPSKPDNGSQDNPFWLSVGDLMSGLLMVFVLLLLSALHQMVQAQEQQQNKREQLLTQLQKDFKTNNIAVTVDQRNGTIAIKDNVLFDSGKSKLTEEGIAFLKKMIPVYAKSLFSKSYARRDVTRILVEGHTDRDGPDDYNWKLSVRRSLSVTSYILSDEMEFPFKKQLGQRLLCAGRGELDANQSTTRSEDRKVVFRIQFRDTKLLDVWNKPLEEPKTPASRRNKPAQPRKTQPAPVRRENKNPTPKAKGQPSPKRDNKPTPTRKTKPTPKRDD